MGDSFVPGGARGKCLAYDGYARATAGAAGNGFSTPDSVSLSITGDIDIDAQIRVVSGGLNIIGKDNGTNDRDYALNLINRVPRFFKTPDGLTTAGHIADATVAMDTLYPIGTVGWVRAKYISATGVVTFYTSPDGTNWTQLGTTVTITSGAMFDGTTALYVAANGSTTYGLDVYRARVYSGDRGAGGVLVADFNPTRYTTGTTWVAATGETWTANGTAQIRWT